MKDKKEKGNNSLFFAVGITILLAVILTWVIKGGSFSGAEFTSGDYTRIGIHELFTLPFYSVYYFVVQVALLFIIAGFYGVVSKTSGYRKLVNSVANAFSHGSVAFVLITTLLIAAFTSLSSQTLVVLAFIPFLISVCKEMKMDKVVAFSATYGAVLLGVLGATIGTEVLTMFSYYGGSTITSLILAKVIIFVVGYILFSLFNVIRLLTKKDNKLELTDPMAIEDEANKKAVAWPLIVTYVVLAVLTILGFINWNTFHETQIFTNLLTKINEFHLGNLYILRDLLGNIGAFGAFSLEAIIVMLSVALVLIAFVYRINPSKLFDNFIDGITKFIKPILLVILAYSIFVIIYLSPFVPTITNALMDSNSAVAPFLASICAMISSLFSVDFGYTAYTLGGYFASSFPDKVNAISLVLTATYGLCMFIFPTSIVLIYGLQYVGISYKEWFKHIWKFILPMFIILEIIFFIII